MGLPYTKEQDGLLSAEDHDANMLFLVGFASLAALLANSTQGYGLYSAGDVVTTELEGFRYRVAEDDASDHQLTTAAGLKLYVLPGNDGAYNFMALNPAGDGVTDDYPVLLKALALPPVPPARGPTITFPIRTFQMNTSIQINSPVHLRGIRTWVGNTIFSFPTGVSGLVINARNTRNGEAIPLADADAMTSGAGSIVENIYFRSNPSGSSDIGTADGLWLRAPALFRDCLFSYFNRCGIRIEAWAEADAPASPHLWGDARGWVLDRCSAIRSGVSGLRVRGNRSGNGRAIACNFTLSGRWGLDDHTPGANIYLGVHVATNGVGTSYGNLNTKSAMVHYVVGGVNHRYAALFVMGDNGDCDPYQMQRFVDVAPGSDPTVWKFIANGTAHPYYPTWQSGRPLGHYFDGGGYKFTGSGGSYSLVGSYAESDDPGSMFYGDGLSMGGIIERAAHGGQLWTRDGGTLQPMLLTATDGGDKARIGDPDDGDTFFSFSREGEGERWTWKWVDRSLEFAYDETNVAFRVLGNFTEETFGRSSPIFSCLHLPVYALGTPTDGRRITYGTAAPTTGRWARGDRVYNSEPSAGGFAAWTCVSGGSPGTWKACLQIGN